MASSQQSIFRSRLSPQTRAEFSESFAVHDLLKVAIIQGAHDAESNARRWLLLHVLSQIGEGVEPVPGESAPCLPLVWRDLLWLMIWEWRRAGVDGGLVNLAQQLVPQITIRRRAACMRAVAAERLHWPLKEQDAA